MQTLYCLNEIIIQSVVNCTINGNSKQRLATGYATMAVFILMVIKNSQPLLNLEIPKELRRILLSRMRLTAVLNGYKKKFPNRN